MEMKFFTCEHCGNIVTYATDRGNRIVCCGDEMQEMVPNTTDASQEKHVPVIIVDNDKVTVKVGSDAHPMIPQHYIEWISLSTTAGNQMKALNPGEAPEVCFKLCKGDSVVATYAFCNLHGLWKA